MEIVWKEEKNLRHTVDLNSGIPQTGKTDEKFMLDEMTQQNFFWENNKAYSMKLKMEKSTLGFYMCLYIYIKYGKFGSVPPELFIKHKPIFSEG